MPQVWDCAPIWWWPKTPQDSPEELKMVDVPRRVLAEAKSRDFKPSVRVGKAGLSETVVEEIRQQLQSRELVKIKVNKGLFEREQKSEVWNYLAQQTNSVLVLQRGNIGVLWRS
jgi:RNA-binding protein